MQDLAGTSADLAIRAGSAGTGDGTVRNLADIELLLVASPTNLERVGRPRDIGDLAALDYIQYKNDPEETSILLDEVRKAPVKVALAAQMPNHLRHAVQSHLGFAKLPRFFVHDLLPRGEIELVMPDEPPLAPRAV